MAHLRFIGREGSYVHPFTLLDWVREHPFASSRIIPVIFWGAAGTGKTAQINAYCKARDLEIRVYHPAHDTSGADIVGRSYKDPETNKTVYALPEWLPTDPDSKGVLFIDELNRANEDVLAGLMEVLGEGAISQSGWQLPPQWQIVCAANPSEVGYQVQDLDEAMVNRMLHYAAGWDAAAWTEWALGAEVPEEVIDFALRHQGTYVNIGEEDLPQEIQAKLKCSPRSMSYVAALFEPGMPDALLRVISQGLIGRDPGDAFRQEVEQTHAREREIAAHAAAVEQGLQTGTEPAPLRPLRAEEILTWSDPEPGSDQSVFSYDRVLDSWLAEQATLSVEELIDASVQRMMAELLSQSPKSDDPYKEKRAQLAGRFLARIPSGPREKALADILRSLRPWHTVIKAATEVWVQNFSERGIYAGARQHPHQTPVRTPAVAPALAGGEQAVAPQSQGASQVEAAQLESGHQPVPEPPAPIAMPPAS